MEDSQWLYYDSSREQKGPIPSNVMSRLLEKGIGVSPDTMVWKAGMDGWKRMSEVSDEIYLVHSAVNIKMIAGGHFQRSMCFYCEAVVLFRR